MVAPNGPVAPLSDTPNAFGEVHDEVSQTKTGTPSPRRPELRVLDVRRSTDAPALLFALRFDQNRLPSANRFGEC